MAAVNSNWMRFKFVKADHDHADFTNYRGIRVLTALSEHIWQEQASIAHANASLSPHSIGSRGIYCYIHSISLSLSIPLMWFAGPESNTTASKATALVQSGNHTNNTNPYKEARKSLRALHLVASAPGHLVVSFHDGRQFVAFDSVPESLKLDTVEHMKLTKFVLNQVNDYFKDLLAVRTASAFIIHLAFLNPIQSLNQAPLITSPSNSYVRWNMHT